MRKTKASIKRFLAAITVTILLFTATITNTSAQEQVLPTAQPEFVRGQIIEVTDEGETEIAGKKYPFQNLKVKISTGEEITIEHGKNTSLLPEQRVKTGDQVVIVKEVSSADGQTIFTIIDKYRLDVVRDLAIMFFIVVVLIAGIKGIGSIVGLGLSLLLILKFIVPQLLEGKNPFFTILIGAVGIITITLFLAHGFTKKTFLALISTYVTLMIVVCLSIFAVSISSLSGLGAEDAYQLRFSGVAFNFQGLLLGGIIIGTLGILDDITTAQTALIFELKKANSKLSFTKLFGSGMRVGKEHIASLVNTLVLAYAGVSMPIFIFFVLNPSNQPTWFILNSEYISQEIVRALVGSFGLVLAVPITTLIAALYVNKLKAQDDK